MHFASCFGACTGFTVLSGFPLCSRCGLVVWMFLLTSPNSGAKIYGGDSRSVKLISGFILSFGASFSSFQFILSTLSRYTREGNHQDCNEIKGIPLRSKYIERDICTSVKETCKRIHVNAKPCLD